MHNRTVLASAVLAGAMGFFAPDAEAGVTSFNLHDHPDGAAAEPFYGLRYDGLFAGLPGATGSTTTFSADTNDASLLVTVDDVAEQIRIHGVVYGGEDTGSTYGFGEGHYQVDFVYNVNFEALPNGWRITSSGDDLLQNHGRVLSLDNADTAGQQWRIYDYASSGPTFLLLADGHRLDNDSSSWVLRGWLSDQADHSNDPGTQDWLLVADPTDCVDPVSIQYSVQAHQGGHALWIPGLNANGHTVRMSFQDDALFTINNDGTASLTGTAEVYDLGGGPGSLGEEWSLDLQLEQRSGPGYGGPKIERPNLQPPWIYDTWDYFDTVSGSLTKPGSELILVERAPVGRFPFQFGDSANNKNQELGASMWFDWWRFDNDQLSRDGHGDINVEMSLTDINCECAGDTYDLGAASDYNVFSCGDYLWGLDVGGKLAAAGNVQMYNFGIGHANPGGTAMVAGGNVSVHNGQFWGDAVYGGTLSQSGIGFPTGGAFSQGNPIDFDAECAGLEATSTAMCSDLVANGDTDVSPWGHVTFTGTDATLNVFNASNNDLNSANGITINAPAGSQVVIQVSGGYVEFSNLGFNLNGVGAADVLWNLCDATGLNIYNISLQGSVLAPFAASWFNNGNIDGQLIVGSVEGSGEAHHVPFNGPVVAPCEDDGPGGDACTVDWKVTNSWWGGFQAEATVTNLLGDISGWTFDWSFTNGETANHIWNVGSWSQSGADVTTTDAGWNGDLPTGGSFNFGVVGNGAPQIPADFTLNGQTCSVD